MILWANLTISEKIEAQSTTIDNLRKENADLYSKLADATRDIYHNLTGGDTYCVLTIGNINLADVPFL